MSPEHSYLLSGSLPTPKPPKWMGGTHPEDLDELPHEIPSHLDSALVDYRVHLLPEETCPYCMELRDTSECCGLIPVLNERPIKLRSPIPVREDWYGRAS